MSWYDKHILRVLRVLLKLRLKRYRLRARRVAKRIKAFNWYLCIGIPETKGMLQVIESELSENENDK